ncbi:pirin family protein [Aestuariivirga sp.]|uniref:pirin family protein n=1 Tax=Aestuariivirga sp. TaxID=2650926 RepID=UPI0039E22A8F
MPGDAAAADAIDLVIVPRARDIGSFEVRRALPSAERQMVGPFIFFDQFGPVLMKAGQGMDVRPHPHIGLSTVTWVYDGVIQHKDSLGFDQPIKPGELNWMTAGKGIVHSERTPPMERTAGQKVFGIQSWVALPKTHEEIAPNFEHVADAALPLLSDKGRSVRIIAGSMYGERSPVKTASDLFYADVVLEAGARLPLPAEHEERGIYISEGSLTIAGDTHEAGRLLVFKPGDEITLSTETGARFMMLGGEPMDGPRYIWWNFVSSSKDKIEAAKDDWKRARFSIVPGDEKEFIPLPET